MVLGDLPYRIEMGLCSLDKSITLDHQIMLVYRKHILPKVGYLQHNSFTNLQNKRLLLPVLRLFSKHISNIKIRFGSGIICCCYRNNNRETISKRHMNTYCPPIRSYNQEIVLYKLYLQLQQHQVNDLCRRTTPELRQWMSTMQLRVRLLRIRIYYCINNGIHYNHSRTL